MVMMIVRHDVSSRASVVERESLDTDSATVRHDVFSRASMVERESVDVDSATVRERDESRRRSFDDDVVVVLASYALYPVSQFTQNVTIALEEISSRESGESR